MAADPMHVVVAAHDFYPDPGSGGTGRYVYETARRLVDRGHRVSVVTRRRGDVPRRETVDGVDVYRYDISIADASAVEILPQVPRARRTVSDHAAALAADAPPDLLSFQGPVTSLLLDSAVGDAPRICTFHSPWPAEYRIKARNRGSPSWPRRRLNVAVRKRLEQSVLSRTDGVLALSEFMRDRLRRTYDLDVEPGVVPGGVDVDRFSPDAGSFDPVDAGGPSFLTVRRLTPRMGHELLLEAFATVADRYPDAELYVAGDGPLRDDVERRAATLGVDDRTTFLGYVPDADLPRAYATADAFVLPTTRLEGFGLATLEALASGVPVIGTRVGATPELLGPLADRSAIPEPLLASATPTALARRLCAWAALSDGERAAAGRACRAYAAEEYPWERTAATLEARYAARVDP